MKIGYYIFFGYGDYHPSSSKNLIELDVNTLMIYLNGHKLPYKSKKYPEIIDANHPNCQEEFLKDLLIYLKKREIEVIAVITTTGHAGKFSDLNPESAIEIANPNSNVENTLISFPEHLKKGKLIKKEGAAQLGYGVLCHNRSSTQKYAENIIVELISIYGEYFDGIALHPPESAYPCSCLECKKLFLMKYDKGLPEFDEAREFFITTYLSFQNTVLFPLIQKIKPDCKLYTFTIPWMFESSFKLISPLISKEIIIIDWDYNLDLNRISTLGKRLTEYISAGNKIWFMPTAGFSFNKDDSIEKQITLVHEQIEIAESNGVSGIIHFLGPKNSDYIVETSRKFLLVNQPTFKL